MTTHFTAHSAAEFTTIVADIDSGPDAAANTAYFVALSAGISIGNLTLTLPAGASLEIDGPGFLVVSAGATLTATGAVTLNAPFTGNVALNGAALHVDPVTTTGGILAGGTFTGQIVGQTATDSLVNDGAIQGSSDTTAAFTGGIVTNDAGGTITAPDIAVSFSANGELDNSGAINASTGASFGQDAVVRNAASGTISTNQLGIAVFGAADLSNLGSITQTATDPNVGGDAVYAQSGTIRNGSAAATGAAISTGANDAIEVAGAGTVTNDAIVTSTDEAGVALGSGEVDNGVANSAAAITGAQFGVDLKGAGTVENLGTISLAGTPSLAGSKVAVLLEHGGSVTNGVAGATATGSATIAGADDGVAILGASGSVANTGTISGAVAVDLEGGGSVVNGGVVNSGGSGVGAIAGTSFGVHAIGAGTTASVLNGGSISGLVGVDFFDAGGSATGTLTDSGSIASTAGLTGTAVRFGAGAERLVLLPGYAITGVVQGGATAGDVTTIELGRGTSGAFTGVAGGAGAITGQFGFQSVAALDIDAGATWSFSGAETLAALQVGGTATVAGRLNVAMLADDAGTLAIGAAATLELGAAAGHGNAITLGAGATLQIDRAAQFGTGQGGAYAGDAIQGFAPGAFIDLADVAFAAASVQGFNAATGVLQVGDGAHTADLTFGGGPAQTLGAFSLHADGSGGTLVETVACYCAGTRIAAPAGEVAVEDIRIGDLIRMADGRAGPVRWIGRRSYAGRFLAGRPHLLPIRFAAGSLGGGLPRRDLLVSPAHAMLLEGVLVPAELLVDGADIRQEARLERVDYVHLEFDRHEAILAEGAASESFVDDGSRMIFQNAHEHPGGRAGPPLYCAPRVTSGPALEEIRQMIAEAAATRPIGRPETAQPSTFAIEKSCDVSFARSGQ